MEYVERQCSYTSLSFCSRRFSERGVYLLKRIGTVQEYGQYVVGMHPTEIHSCSGCAPPFPIFFILMEFLTHFGQLLGWRPLFGEILDPVLQCSFSVGNKFRENTRIDSSRMRTACLLTVSWSAYREGSAYKNGVCP